MDNSAVYQYLFYKSLICRDKSNMKQSVKYSSKKCVALSKNIFHFKILNSLSLENYAPTIKSAGS